MFDLPAKRAMNQGFGDTLTRSFELIFTPALFVLVGWWVDGLLGTGPWLAVTAGAFGVAGVFAKMWLVYENAMRVEHQRMVAARAAATSTRRPASDPGEVR